MRPRVAIVLFNLGGPDRPEAIKPFLVNLFTDPSILRVPFFVRPFLARAIARARLDAARANYAVLGGRSPLLELTQQQATSLEQALPEFEAKCFIAMRYWHPFSCETAQAVRGWSPDEIVLLPLYPQYSTTTTGSSLTAWHEAAARAGLVADVTALCCYPADSGYVAAMSALLQRAWNTARAELGSATALRVLFSAHGLPEVIVRQGDPYQWQVEQTVTSILTAWGERDVDWRICYQSRATPQKWLDPSTEVEIERAAHDKVGVVIVPVAFVSEHSETLVELDVEYRALAERLGVPAYYRVPTPNSDPRFIAALADMVRQVRLRGTGLCSHAGRRVCPSHFSNCPLAAA